MARRKQALALVAVLALTTGADAAEREGSTYFAPMAHARWHDDARPVRDDFDYSLALGRAVDEDWNLELHVSRGEFESGSGNDLELTHAGLNVLRVFYRDSRIAPYFLLGAGWSESNPELGATEHDPYADTAFGLLVQLGQDRGGRSTFSLRGEVGGRHTFVGDDRRLVDYRLGIGFQWGFGGSGRSTPMASVPAGSRAFDSDADGIRDDSDRCPGTPPGARIDETGCERDSDGDGVLDSRDKCPGTRPGLTVDATGCEADSDGDGVLESRDRCPGTPRGDRIDAAGCSLTVRLEVRFENNSAQLRPESAGDLDRAAALLRDVPSITGVIEGHTDSLGSEAHNQQLSQRRAEAVRRYLVDKGVNEDRLTARGFGESQPVADNATPEGRAQNRRVVLTRTDQR